MPSDGKQCRTVVHQIKLNGPVVCGACGEQVGPKEWNVQLVISLTAGQIERVDKLIKATTDTGATPVSTEEYIRQIVVDAITPREAGSDTSGY